MILFKKFLVASYLIVHLQNAFGSNRIVGGIEARIEYYPYQIQLKLQKGTPFCGGSIISIYVIVTAAHCLKPRLAQIEMLQILVGSDQRNKGSVFEAKKVFIHPNFSEVSNENDIALISLKTPVYYGPKQQPLILPDLSFYIPDGAILTVTGFGVYNLTVSSQSPVLRVIKLPIINEDRCRSEIYRMTKKKVSADTSQFCVGMLGTKEKDACNGDSGSPAMYDNFLVGVVSWGLFCGRPENPGIYTNVARMRPWILSTMENM